MRVNKKIIINIIVVYRPKLKLLEKVLVAHKNNSPNVIIVNNSPEISPDSFKSPQVTNINNPGNIGLASALNIGILEAKKQGAEMVALFDQDTLLPDDFFAKHTETYQCLSRR